MLGAMLGCGRSDDGTMRASSTDVEKLSATITLPVRPISARWQIIELSRGDGLGPGDWALIAYLVCDAAGMKKVLASAVRTTGDAPDVSIMKAVDAPMRAALERMHLDASSVTFDARAFYRSPLMHGVIITKPGQSGFFMYLYTM